MSLRDFLRVYILSAIFVAAGLWIVALNPSTYHPTTSTPRKAGATFTHKEKGLEAIGPANVSAGVTDRRDGRLARESSGALGKTSMAHAQGVRVSARGGDPSRLGLFALKMGREGRGASAQDLRALATSAAHLCGVPVAIFHALIQRESSWRPSVVSSSGAVGLGQIKPSTLRDIDPRLNAWDPWDNLLGSACYLRQQFDRFGTWRKALHAYHAGPNRKTTRRATHDYASDIMGAN